jgi:hypothetical protein
MENLVLLEFAMVAAALQPSFWSSCKLFLFFIVQTFFPWNKKSFLTEVSKGNPSLSFSFF